MTTITWQPAMNIGIVDIDEEHRELLGMLNLLQQKWEQGDALTATYVCLADMKQYALSHFGREETMMAEAGFPELEEHRAEHAVFLQNAHVFYEQLESGGNSAGNVLTYLAIWFTNHILVTDRRFSSYLQMRV